MPYILEIEPAYIQGRQTQIKRFLGMISGKGPEKSCWTKGQP